MQDKLNAKTLPRIINILTRLCESGESYKITTKDWSIRGLDANAQIWVWYHFISAWDANSIEYVEALNKRDFGLPILLADAEHGPIVGEMLNKYDFYNLDETDQLKIMQYLPVTRLFSTRQHKQYRDSMQRGWYERGIQLDYLK